MPSGDHDLLAHFPVGATPRPDQARLLRALGDALWNAEADPAAPRLFAVEAPPGVGKSHIAVAVARWSGSAYLLTSQKLLQDQYEREFGRELSIVKGRDNYVCERYPAARVPTSQGRCRRPRGPACACPYARAKAAAFAGPIFCTNTAYFLTLRQWSSDPLPRRRVLIVDEAHGLEAQLTRSLTVAFSAAQMVEWFGAPLPRLDTADDYVPLLEDHLARLEARHGVVERELETLHPPGTPEEVLLLSPGPEEMRLLDEREMLTTAVAGIRRFLDASDREWTVRYPARPDTTLELVPLTAGQAAGPLLLESADAVVLSSAYLGPPAALADVLGVPEEGIRAFASGSPFTLEQRPIVYRPVGRLSRATRPGLEPALAAAIATLLADHPTEKGLIHVTSYAMARRLLDLLADISPRESRRLVFVAPGTDKTEALERHRESRQPTVLVSPALREGVDLPDEFLRFQIVAKLPYPDLGDPWTAARRQRDPRWYAVEAVKALVQAYGRACRHADDRGVTYVLDGQLESFLSHNRVLLPEWFLEAVVPAVRDYRSVVDRDGGSERFAE